MKKTLVKILRRIDSYLSDEPRPRRRLARKRWGAIIVVVLAIIGLLMWYFAHHNVAVLNPAGQVGYQERKLIIFALLLAVIVVVPTFGLTIFIVWKYREDSHISKKRTVKYNPDWDHSVLFESIWWGVPMVIIAVLSVVAWRSAHSLDPYKPLASDKKPLTIQVVSLDWKWLFIYPDQHVASVDQFMIPTNTPVHFYLTSDTVMNSFWLPSLGGQIMTMPGMQTQIYENATRPGVYAGSSANISGSGFARMTFNVRAGSQQAFNAWITQTQTAPHQLNLASYNTLARHNVPKTLLSYSSVQPGLFDYVILKYMMPGGAKMPLPAKPTSMPNKAMSMMGMKT